MRIEHDPSLVFVEQAIRFTTTDEEINPALFFHLGWDQHAELKSMSSDQHLTCIGARGRGRYILALLVRELMDGRWNIWPPLMRRSGASVLQAGCRPQCSNAGSLGSRHNAARQV